MVNTEMLMDFLQINNKKVFEIKNTILFTLAPLEVKYFSKNQDIDTIFVRKTKTLMKHTKEELNKWRNMLYSWIGRLSTVKMSVLFNLKYGFKTSPTKIPTHFSYIDEGHLKFIQTGKDAYQLTDM